jgi:hypothetical protein
MTSTIQNHENFVAVVRSETVPSFVLLDVQEGLLTIYVYELIPSAAGDGEFELKVQELKHKKG